MDTNELSEIKVAFEKANNKNGCFFVMSADAAKLPDDKIKKYLRPELPPEKLMEVLTAIVDQVPEEQLNLFINNSDAMDVSEMRRIRLSNRNDHILNIISEGVQKCTESIEYSSSYLATSHEISEVMKELKKSNKLALEISKTVQEMKEAKGMEIKKNEEEIKKETVEAANSSLAGDGITKYDYAASAGGQDVVIESAEKEVKENRLKMLFKMSNKKKVITDTDKKLEVLKELIEICPTDEQLSAVTEAVSEGVPADFLRYYLNKEAPAERLKAYTRAYLALYSLNATANA